MPNTADRILDKLDQMPNDFTTFRSVGFLDVDGSGTDKLMIGADFAGVSSVGVDTAIFDVSHQKLHPLISVTSLALYEGESENLDIHTMTLDEPRTRLAKGKRFFFIKKTYAEKAKVFPKVVTALVSYPAGSGVPLNWR